MVNISPDIQEQQNMPDQKNASNEGIVVAGIPVDEEKNQCIQEGPPIETEPRDN